VVYGKYGHPEHGRQWRQWRFNGPIPVKRDANSNGGSENWRLWLKRHIQR
jgi:hypothetical protein